MPLRQLERELVRPLAELGVDDGTYLAPAQAVIEQYLHGTSVQHYGERVTVGACLKYASGGHEHQLNIEQRRVGGIRALLSSSGFSDLTSSRSSARYVGKQ